MSRAQFWQTLTVLALLAPFVVAQGAPELVPKRFTSPLLGIPGTALITSICLAAFVLLSWYYARKHEEQVR